MTRRNSESGAVSRPLADSHDRLQAILDAAIDGIVTIDRAGQIVSVNRAASRMFGYDAEELVGQNVSKLMPTPFREEHDQYIARYLATGEARVIGIGREALGRRKDGTSFPIDLAVSEVESLGLFTGIVRDITERKKALEALRREHELNESMINTTQNIILVLDVEGRIVRFNPYMEQLTGWALDELRGRDWFETFVPAHLRADVRQLFERAIGGQRTRGFLNAIITKSGDEREICWFDAPLTDAHGNLVGLLCTGSDVTERRHLEREILEIAADEQRRMGQELHDSTQQQLTGLRLLAKNLADALRRLSADIQSRYHDTELHEQLRQLWDRADRISSGLDVAAKEVHLLARGLVPVELDARGLMSALGDLALRIHELGQATCTFHCDRLIEIDDNFTATHLYRIAQEAVQNALKHSRADRIEVALDESDEFVILQVKDNGHGIDRKFGDSRGMGLRIMAYRAEIIHAELTIGPAESGGTLVRCQVKRHMPADRQSTAERTPLRRTPSAKAHR